MLLTCCFTRSAIKPTGGTDLVSLSGGALRALMSINCPFTLPTEIGFFSSHASPSQGNQAGILA